MANKQDAIKLGLTEYEFNEIVKTLGREPNFLELGLYGDVV